MSSSSLCNENIEPQKPRSKEELDSKSKSSPSHRNRVLPLKNIAIEDDTAESIPHGRCEYRCYSPSNAFRKLSTGSEPSSPAQITLHHQHHNRSRHSFRGLYPSSPKPSESAISQDTDFHEEDDDVSVSSATAYSRSSFDLHHEDLKMEGKGIIGLFERIPLCGKLSLMSICILIGMALVTGLTVALSVGRINRDSSNFQLSSFGFDMETTIHELQLERGMTQLFMIKSNGSTHAEDSFPWSIEQGLELMMNQRSIVDQRLQMKERELRRIYEAERSPITKKMLKSLLQSIDKLPNFRQLVNSGTISVEAVFEYYSEMIKWFIETYQRRISGDILKDIIGYNVLSKCKEIASRQRGFGVIVIRDLLFNEKTYVQFATYFQSQKLLLDQVRAIVSDSLWEIYVDKMNHSTIDALENYIEFIVFHPTNITSINVSVDEWWKNYTLKVDTMREVLEEWSLQLTGQARSSILLSSLQLSTILLVILMVFVSTIFCLCCTSRTIIGPWRRMNDIQEQTISKFVPKGFLKLVRCKRISEIKMGMAVRREVTIMFADIRNFTSMSEKMTIEQNFSFLNSYLSTVGPIIRRHGGYIDKFIGDGILALFTSPDSSLKASMEMLDAVERLNQQNQGTVADNDESFSYPLIKIGIGIHTGNVLVGAVGDHERMEGTIISDAVNLASRLEGLTKKYKTTIIVSGETMNKSKNQKKFHHRYLGRVIVKGKTLPTDIFELLGARNFAQKDVNNDKETPQIRLCDIHEIKVKTKRLFNDAMKLMMQRNYKESAEQWDNLLAQNPQDGCASYFRSLCDYLSKEVSEWNGIQVIDEK